MDRKKRDEITYRRRAIRLTLKGQRPCEILRRIPRGREGLRKWRLRYEHPGWAGLASGSHRPPHAPHEDSRAARAGGGNLRRKLTRSWGGGGGARAVRPELLRCRLLRDGPSAATITRGVKEAGVIQRGAPPPEKVSYPQPRLTQDRVLHVRDWRARYSEGGEKIFAFHTVAWPTRALPPTLKANKTVARVTAQGLETWQKRGLPDFLQLAHEAAFTGGSKPPRRFGAFVRLALSGGMELIFTPPAAPKRHGLGESLTGLWAAKFWERHHLRSLREVERQRTKFTAWYAHRYYPPALEGLTPARALTRVKRQRLTQAHARALPPRLPLTAGRGHFMRRVSPPGERSLLGDTWRVSTRLAGH